MVAKANKTSKNTTNEILIVILTLSATICLFVVKVNKLTSNIVSINMACRREHVRWSSEQVTLGAIAVTAA